MCLEQEQQEHNPRSKNTNPEIKKKKNREWTRHQEIELRRWKIWVLITEWDLGFEQSFTPLPQPHYVHSHHHNFSFSLLLPYTSFLILHPQSLNKRHGCCCFFLFFRRDHRHHPTVVPLPLLLPLLAPSTAQIQAQPQTPTETPI